MTAITEPSPDGHVLRCPKCGWYMTTSMTGELRHEGNDSEEVSFSMNTKEAIRAGRHKMSDEEFYAYIMGDFGATNHPSKPRKFR